MKSGKFRFIELFQITGVISTEPQASGEIRYSKRRLRIPRLPLVARNDTGERFGKPKFVFTEKAGTEVPALYII